MIANGPSMRQAQWPGPPTQGRQHVHAVAIGSAIRLCV